MELNIVQQLISKLPAGEKRDALMRKINAVSRRKENTGGGLHDEFALQPKGHIMIEEIDASGNVLGVLADQPNLVVKGSEEILLRAFSGDPKRTLYKNRKIKEYKNASNVVVNGISRQYNVELSTLTMVLNGEDVVPHHQNEVWNAVNDEDFEIEYSYYPNTLYVKPDPVALEPGKITFKVYDKANAPSGAAPLQAEVYSNYSNLFIGLGDGKNRRIAFEDERLEITGFTTEEDDTLKTSTTGHKVDFTSKISNLKIVAKGEGSLKVTVASEVKGTYPLTGGEDVVIEIEELDGSLESKVTIEATADAETIIKDIYFDEFTVTDNALISEFENHTLRFDTETVYNSNSEKGPQGTYIIKLNNAPIKADTAVFTYDAAKLTSVGTIGELESGKYFLEADKGILHLAEPLTGVLATYEVTGEIHEDEPYTKLATSTTPIVRKAIVDSGDVTLTSQLNGVKTVFSLGFQRIQSPESVVVELNGAPQTVDVNYTLNALTGELTIIPGDSGVPSSPSTLVVKSFKYEKHTSTTLNTYVMTLQKEVDNKKVRVIDQTGKALTFVEATTDLTEGKFTVRNNSAGKAKELVIARQNESLAAITTVDAYYFSLELPGVPTNYTRQVIEKPKAQNEYPWFQLDKGKLVFVAEFPENTPGHNVTIREMGLFDGPRVDDRIRGFNNYNVKAFSLVRVGKTRKEATTGLRVTWTITLLNEEGTPFRGGL